MRQERARAARLTVAESGARPAATQATEEYVVRGFSGRAARAVARPRARGGTCAHARTRSC